MSLNLQKLFIPTDWNESTVGKACDIHNNLRLPISKNDRKKMQGIYPYYGATGILDYIDHYRVDGKFALIGEDGDHFLKFRNLPMTLLVKGQFNVNNHAHIVSGREGCLTEWFYHFFRHTDIYPFLTRQGVGRYKLNKAALEQLPILLPPIPEQLKIISILNTWDNAITLTENLIDALHRRKRGIMQLLLSGEKRFPGFHGDWQESSLMQIFASRSEKSSQSQGYELFSLTIQEGVTPKTKRYNREFLVRSDNKVYKKVYPGDVVYNPSNLRWGAIGLSREEKIVLISPIYEVLYLREANKFNNDYIFYLLSNPDQIQRFSQLGEGTLVERIAVKLDAFLSSKLSMSLNLIEQQKIASILNTSGEHIELLLNYKKLLHEQKKYLQQCLITGEIRTAID